MNANFKTPRFISKKMTDFAKGQDCLLMTDECRRDPQYTVHCHIRRFGVAGTSLKPHDFLGYHGCDRCHAIQERGDAGDDDILRALMLTQIRIYREFGTLTP